MSKEVEIPSVVRVAILTNLTTTISLPVAQSLDSDQSIELVHSYFYDTLSEGKGSLITYMKRNGVLRVAQKVVELLGSKLRVRLGGLLRPQSAYELACGKRLSHSIVASMNKEENTKHLESLGVNVLLVCGCKNILGKRLLSIAGLTVVNIHDSLLPKYRGPSPSFWALYHAEAEAGVSIHVLTQEIDDGPILKQVAIPLDDNTTETSLENEAFRIAAEELPSVLLDFHAGSLTPEPQNREESSYFSYPTPEDRKQLLVRRRAK